MLLGLWQKSEVRGHISSGIKSAAQPHFQPHSLNSSCKATLQDSFHTIGKPLDLSSIVSFMFCNFYLFVLICK